MSRSESNKHAILNRRQALLLPADGGHGGRAGWNSQGVRQHQDRRAPGAGKLAPRRVRPSRTRNTARCAVFSMAASSRSKECRMARTRAAKTAGFRPKPPKPWTGEYPALIYGANCPQHLHDFTAIEQSFHSGLGRRLPERRHAQAERLDAQPDRQAPGDGLFSWRRLLLRLVL